MRHVESAVDPGRVNGVEHTAGDERERLDVFGGAAELERKSGHEIVEWHRPFVPSSVECRAGRLLS